MKQITIRVDTDEQAEQIKEVLSDFDFVVSMGVDTLWPSNGKADSGVIKIIESDIGPMISESRASVYDVMEAYDEGYSPAEIRDIYNLSFHQVEVALEYIEQHRPTLEPKLKEILRKADEREKYYRALEAEREKQFPTEITPRRKAIQALVEESRRKRGAI
ncbi:DUF433 domain-containing protein [Chloroflexi bacterium TSY]|nr:DUF433 domain-containing protein [Chloroflexi bacterium TSY]